MGVNPARVRKEHFLFPAEAPRWGRLPRPVTHSCAPEVHRELAADPGLDAHGRGLESDPGHRPRIGIGDSIQHPSVDAVRAMEPRMKDFLVWA